VEDIPGPDITAADAPTEVAGNNHSQSDTVIGIGNTPRQNRKRPHPTMEAESPTKRRKVAAKHAVFKPRDILEWNTYKEKIPETARCLKGSDVQPVPSMCRDCPKLIEEWINNKVRSTGYYITSAAELGIKCDSCNNVLLANYLKAKSLYKPLSTARVLYYVMGRL
jgi:hypothetical protein